MDKALDIAVGSQMTPLLEQVAGRGRGRVFELSIDKISLGREENNDIIIDDESVSRLHASIEKNAQGDFVIRDNQSRNGIIVNKEKIHTHVLSHGDIIQMGHFVFRFRVPEMSNAGAEAQVVPSTLEPISHNISKLPGGDKKRLYIWGGALLIIGAVWMLNDSEDKPKEALNNPASGVKEESFTPSSVGELREKTNQQDTSLLADPLSKADKEISALENSDSATKESELYFRKGQRDFFNKNYLNAINNFDTAISLWMRHPLASYYKSLAVHDSESEAQKNREIALKYFNSLQYERAKYHFKLAIEYLAHTSAENKPARRMIQECEKYIDFINRKLKAVEMAP